LSATTAGSGSSATTAAAAAPTGSPFKVLAIIGTSGSLAGTAQAYVQALNASAGVVNKEGGILGHPVQISIKNDNLDPTTAANLLQSEISNGNMPNLVFAGTTSNETLALVPILTQNKLLSMQATVSNQTIDPTKYPYAFTLGPATPDAAAGLTASLKTQYPNAKTVAMIIGNDVNGNSLLGNEKAALEQAGLKVVVQQYDPKATVDMTPQLQALQAQHPDVLVASGFGQVAGYILAGRAKLGWNIPVVGDNSFSANNLVSLGTPDQLKGVSVSSNKATIYEPVDQRPPAFQTFYNAVQAQGGKFDQPIAIYGIAYDVVQLAKLAAEQAKSTDTQAMTQALENLQQPSPLPYVTYASEQFSSTKHSPTLDPNNTVQASPYSKDGQALPFGQTS
jgi:branched-chain amino acid transport system substrate-binding protein